MKKEIINTGSYLLVVSDEHLTDMPNNINVYSVRYGNVIKFAEVENSYMNECFEILAHLPLNNSPILEGVDLLPPLLIKCYCGHTTYCDCVPLEQEDDVEKLADIEYEESRGNGTEYAAGAYSGFISGYNKAKEKYRFTEEDIYKAIQYGREVHYTNDQPFIQSLSQPKLPVAFKQGNTVDGKTYTSVTRRHDGFTVWIGEYIY